MLPTQVRLIVKVISGLFCQKQEKDLLRKPAKEN